MKPGRKPSTKGAKETLKIRLPIGDLNRAKHLAQIYAGGNLSKWARHALLNAPRKFLK